MKRQYKFCVHYSQSYSTCAAGIYVPDVTGADGLVPCLHVDGTKSTCAKFKLAEQAKIDTGPMEKMLSSFLDGKCPKCGEVIAGDMEFNDSILALPCRHVIRSAR